MDPNLVDPQNLFNINFENNFHNIIIFIKKDISTNLCLIITYFCMFDCQSVPIYISNDFTRNRKPAYYRQSIIINIIVKFS